MITRYGGRIKEYVMSSPGERAQLRFITSDIKHKDEKKTPQSTYEWLPSAISVGKRKAPFQAQEDEERMRGRSRL